MDWRKIIGVLLLALAGIQTIPKPSNDFTGTAAIVERAIVGELDKKVKFYRSLADRIDANEFTDAAAIESIVRAEIPKIQAESNLPIQADAVANLPTGKLEPADAGKMAAWYRALATGLEGAAR
jgi:hypothetical protein